MTELSHFITVTDTEKVRGTQKEREAVSVSEYGLGKNQGLQIKHFLTHVSSTFSYYVYVTSIPKVNK